MRWALKRYETAKRVGAAPVAMAWLVALLFTVYWYGEVQEGEKAELRNRIAEIAEAQKGLTKGQKNLFSVLKKSNLPEVTTEPSLKRWRISGIEVEALQDGFPGIQPGAWRSMLEPVNSAGNPIDMPFELFGEGASVPKRHAYPGKQMEVLLRPGEN